MRRFRVIVLLFYCCAAVLARREPQLCGTNAETEKAQVDASARFTARVFGQILGGGDLAEKGLTAFFKFTIQGDIDQAKTGGIYWNPTMDGM